MAAMGCWPSRAARPRWPGLSAGFCATRPNAGSWACTGGPKWRAATTGGRSGGGSKGSTAGRWPNTGRSRSCTWKRPAGWRRGAETDYVLRNAYCVIRRATRGNKRMNIWLLGDFSPEMDEGYKNTSHQLARGLERRHTVTRLNVKRVGTAEFWRALRGSRPQIIHTIAQPTAPSLVLTRLLQAARPGARTVVSALRPEQYFAGDTASDGQRMLLRLARPDLVLVQNVAAAARFRQADCPTALLPNGVDLARFSPVSPRRKAELRARYGLHPGLPVVLHVGHLHTARNLTALAPLAA